MGEGPKSYIGIYGGTFDPIHFGHLRPALDVMTRLALQQVRFMPCYQPVHRGQPGAGAQARCEMIERAIAGQAGFVLDRREIDRGGPSYMVDSLASIRSELGTTAQAPGLVLMMGLDAFHHFLSWQQWSKILQLAHIALMHRPGEPLPTQGELAMLFAQRRVCALSGWSGQIIDVDVTQLAISATAIRAMLAQHQSIDYLMPLSVVEYIKMQQLYLSLT
ncbi:MAG: nicotinate-nucleotide adenylyltransferase [Thiomicrospira sp.]